MRKNPQIVVEIGEADINGCKMTDLKLEGVRSDVFAVLHLLITGGRKVDQPGNYEVRDSSGKFVSGGVASS